MTTMASTLLDFILGLFRDEDAAAAFREDPHAALAAAGLDDVDPSDVHALMPMVADSSPSAYHGHGKDDDKDHDDHDDKDHDDHDGHGYHKPAKDEDCDDDDGHWHKVWHDDDDDCDDGEKDHHDGGRPNHDYAGHGHEAAVIHNVKYVENNYSYDNDVEFEVENGIWAGGDVDAIFGNGNVVADNGSVAAGDDVKGVAIDNSETDVDVEITESFNEDSYNSTDVSGNGNAVGEDNEVETEIDTEIDVENSGNTQTGTGNVVGEDNDVETENSGNEVTGDNNAVGEDNEAGTEIDVELENSLNKVDGDGNNIGEDNESDFSEEEFEVDVEIDDIVTGDNSAGDDLEQEAEIEDNLIVVIPEPLAVDAAAAG